MNIDRELKRGSTEMMILALVEEQPRHGYEILKLLTHRSGGALQFHVGSVYPVLLRMEKRRWLRSQEDCDSRRRRQYTITALGRQALANQRGTWQELAAAIARVARIGDA